MMTRVQQVSGLATAPSLANPTVYSAVWFTQTHTDTHGPICVTKHDMGGLTPGDLVFTVRGSSTEMQTGA